MLDVYESVPSKTLGDRNVSAGRLPLKGRVASSSADATAGESERIFGFRVSDSSLCMSTNSSNSSGCGVGVDCARLPAVLGVSATASSFASAPASPAVVAQARSTPMHDAHNSWSDSFHFLGGVKRFRITGKSSAVTRAHVSFGDLKTHKRWKRLVPQGTELLRIEEGLPPVLFPRTGVG